MQDGPRQTLFGWYRSSALLNLHLQCALVCGQLAVVQSFGKATIVHGVGTTSPPELRVH